MTSAQLFGPDGDVTYEAPVRAVPGTYAALYDDDMVQLSGWAMIGMDWTARFTPVHTEGLVRYAVLWDGRERMRRTVIDVPMLVNPENVPVELTFEGPTRVRADAD